ncbi:MAG: DNA cytosine methyltransferase [Myxococcales bacterium]|nr:DNA cytosine methyltransferase [Myxococcales bacterium]
MRAKVISLFSGAGGIDYGLEAAGFETSVALEMDHDCCATLRSSRPHWTVIEDDIMNVSSDTILDAARLRPGEASLLVGGPPCQPFSKAGYWSRGDSLRLDDPRANTLSAYMRVVEDALPAVFLLENVEGLAYEGKDEGLQFLLDRVSKINRRTKSRYTPVIQKLNFAEFGVPQIRERVLVVASRDGTAFRFPSPTFADATETEFLPGTGRPQFRTAWDALADVHSDSSEDLAVRGKWADLLPSIPEGCNYLFHTDRGEGMPLFGWRRRFWTFLLKLSKARPSWTLQAQPGPAVGPFHWQNRRLSMRELCRLQTFPDDVSICGGRTSVQRQVGNAVPSLMAEVLGRAIRAQLLGMAPRRGPLRLLPPDRGAPPPPEPVASVPRKFRPLVGDHEAHPGTGKGYGALARGREAFTV